LNNQPAPTRGRPSCLPLVGGNEASVITNELALAPFISANSHHIPIFIGENGRITAVVPNSTTAPPVQVSGRIRTAFYPNAHFAIGRQGIFRKTNKKAATKMAAAF
jgi:hypothetical protein